MQAAAATQVSAGLCGLLYPCLLWAVLQHTDGAGWQCQADLGVGLAIQPKKAGYQVCSAKTDALSQYSIHLDCQLGAGAAGWVLQEKHSCIQAGFSLYMPINSHMLVRRLTDIKKPTGGRHEGGALHTALPLVHMKLLRWTGRKQMFRHSVSLREHYTIYGACNKLAGMI